MKTQLQRLEKLLLKGCTSMDIIRVCRTTTPTRRLSDCRDKGWTITKVKVSGKNYHRFYGKAPKKACTGKK